MYVGPNHIKIVAQIDAAYPDEFLHSICERLRTKDADKIEYFIERVKYSSVSYLNAIDMNSDRITPKQQNKLLDDYGSSLKEVQIRYRAVQEYGTSRAKFHKALRKRVEETEGTGMQEMFSPYVTLDKSEEVLGGIAISVFDKFLDVLIDAAEDAPNQSVGNDKAEIKGKFLVEWVASMAKSWPHYTQTSFAMGDWIKNDDSQIENSESNGKKGMYKSLCLDVLYDLLKAADKKITRSDLETAMRKFKKTK
tara:strand:+ start:81027 stop:81779 length:753 start_codon:yes stop_codon:yes gene_type:complete